MTDIIVSPKKKISIQQICGNDYFCFYHAKEDYIFLSGTDTDKIAEYVFDNSFDDAVVHILNHEILHSIINKHLGNDACRSLDNLIYTVTKAYTQKEKMKILNDCFIW